MPISELKTLTRCDTFGASGYAHVGFRNSGFKHSAYDRLNDVEPNADVQTKTLMEASLRASQHRTRSEYCDAETPVFKLNSLVSEALQALGLWLVMEFMVRGSKILGQHVAIRK